MLEGCAERVVREHNADAWLAWHIGALTRTSKKYPSLDSMLTKSRKPMPQTWQQQLAIAQMWSGMRLGKIRTPKRVN